MRAAPFALAPALALALLLAGCAQDEPTMPTIIPTCSVVVLPPVDPAWKPEMPRVRIETTKGSLVVELDMERAPITAQNFLNLTTSGVYDGTLFHRVVRNFVIQGGDPLSKDANPANDGTGDAGYAIPDEFHPALRHDAAGVLSMANSGPNTGGSQFFVTLNATPHLDDRHSVFGRVVEGLDVVRVIGNAQVDSEDRPVDPAQLVKAEVLDPTEYEMTTGADLHVVVADKKAEGGRLVRFAVVLTNSGNVRDALVLTADVPGGWACTAEPPAVVPAGSARVVFLSLTPDAGAEGTTTIPLKVSSARGGSATSSLNVTIAPLGKAIAQGDKVTANYAGLLPDGRLFDTSMERVAKDPDQAKFTTLGGYHDKPAYGTFAFTVGSGVIPGFTNLAKTAKVGETVTGLIPAKDAYATGSVYDRPLTGRDLIFELEIVSSP